MTRTETFEVVVARTRPSILFGVGGAGDIAVDAVVRIRPGADDDARRCAIGHVALDLPRLADARIGAGQRLHDLVAIVRHIVRGLAAEALCLARIPGDRAVAPARYRPSWRRCRPRGRPARRSPRTRRAGPPRRRPWRNPETRDFEAKKGMRFLPPLLQVVSAAWRARALRRPPVEPFPLPRTIPLSSPPRQHVARLRFWTLGKRCEKASQRLGWNGGQSGNQPI